MESDRRIIGLHLSRAEEHEAYRAAVGDSSAEVAEPLQVLLEAAAAENVVIEPISFVSREPASDIVRIAEESGCRLILMGFHKPVIGQTFLGGTVHRVLENAKADVAVFIDRGLHGRPRSILVPFLGSPHDKLALETASRIGRHAGAAITILHVIAPKHASGAAPTAPDGDQCIADRAFEDPTQPVPVTFKLVEHSDPISAVLEHSMTFDLVAIGVAEEWGLTSQLFGRRSERVARDCPSSLLIFRKHKGEVTAVRAE